MKGCRSISQSYTYVTIIRFFFGDWKTELMESNSKHFLRMNSVFLNSKRSHVCGGPSQCNSTHMSSKTHTRQSEALRFLAITGIGIAGLQLLVVVTHDLSERTDLFAEVAALAPTSPVVKAPIVECETATPELNAD